MGSHVFGPVPSRRLGRSLGVSIVPAKTCTYSCCYCQLGRTTDRTLERRRFYPPGDIIDDIRTALDAGDQVDHVTFIGDGEPTLCSDLGLLIEEVKGRSEVPVAVVTNGSLLFDPHVREELMAADRVLPTLAACRPKAWRHMHRPHPKLDLTTIIEGMATFAREYPGDIWLEVMLVQGLNDTDEDLLALREVIDRVGPGRVDLLVPTRPPAEDWVRPPDPERVLRAQEILGSGEALVREPDGSFSVSAYESGREAILAIGSRHPLREDVARELCGRLDDEGAIEEMVMEGDLERVRFHGTNFLLPRELVDQEEG